MHFGVGEMVKFKAGRDGPSGYAFLDGQGRIFTTRSDHIFAILRKAGVCDGEGRSLRFIVPVQSGIAADIEVPRWGRILLRAEDYPELKHDTYLFPYLASLALDEQLLPLRSQRPRFAPFAAELATRVHEHFAPTLLAKIHARYLAYK